MCAVVSTLALESDVLWLRHGRRNNNDVHFRAMAPHTGPNWKHLYKPRNGNTFPYSWECLHAVEVLREQQETVLWAADGQLKRGEIHKSRQPLFPDNRVGKLRPEVWGFETWSDGFSQSEVSSRMRHVCCEKLAEAMLRFSDMWFPV